MWDLWNAPSDRDYYESMLGVYPNDEEPDENPEPEEIEATEESQPIECPF